MRENHEDWELQLETVILEITGLSEIFIHDSCFVQLLSKLEGLLMLDTDFTVFRKTVFEIISLIQEGKNG